MSERKQGIDLPPAWAGWAKRQYKTFSGNYLRTAPAGVPLNLGLYDFPPRLTSMDIPKRNGNFPDRPASEQADRQDVSPDRHANSLYPRRIPL